MGEPMGRSTEKPRKKQRWLWALGVGLAILIVLSGLEHFGGGPREYQVVGQTPSNCTRPFAPTLTRGPHYTGLLFDAHYHIPPAFKGIQPFIKQPILGQDLTINDVVCTFDKEGVRGALGFYLPRKTSGVMVEAARAINQVFGDRLTLFLAPSYISVEETRQLLDEHPGLFAGLGEIQFYELTNLVRPLDGEWMTGLLDLAREQNLLVMVHPGQGQLALLEERLRSYNDVTFLLHGHEIEQEIDRLIETYPNVSYSVDGAVLVSLRGDMVRKSGEEYLGRLRREFRDVLAEKVGFWRDKIGRHPDRYLWGTDKSAVSNYSEEASVLIEEFSRAFIGQLDPAVQDAYAYRNAETLLSLPSN